MTWIPPFPEKSRLHTFLEIRTFVYVISNNWASSIHAEHL